MRSVSEFPGGGSAGRRRCWTRRGWSGCVVCARSRTVRAYNPDVIRRDLARVLIRAHRSLTRRHDHTPSEAAWLARTVEALQVFIGDAFGMVRPRLHRQRRGRVTRWTRAETRGREGVA